MYSIQFHFILSILSSFRLLYFILFVHLFFHLFNYIFYSFIYPSIYPFLHLFLNSSMRTFIQSFIVIILCIAAFGFTACNHCVASNAASCSAIQKLQSCADLSSLGTSHCGSAVGRYLDPTGKVLDVFYRGCIDCTGEWTLNVVCRLRSSRLSIYEKQKANNSHVAQDHLRRTLPLFAFNAYSLWNERENACAL